MLIKHVLSHFTKFVKTRFLAQKSGSQLRCQTMLQMLWNIQKTPPKHVKRLSNFLFLNTVLGSNIRSSAQMSNNAKKKKHETIRKHQLNMFWGFLRIFWKSGSRLKNPVLGSDVEQCKTYLETPRKHQQNMFWGFLRISWTSGSRLKNPVLGSDFELC